MKGRRVLGWAMLVAVIVIFAWLFHESWPVIVDMLTGARWYMVAVSVFLLSLGNIQIGIVFASIVRRYSVGQLRFESIVGAFLASQVAKYIPGRVWGVAMQSGMLRAPGSTVAIVGANVELSILVLAVVSGVGLACLVGWTAGLPAAAVVLFATFGGCALMLRLDIVWRLVSLASKFVRGIAKFIPSGRAPWAVDHGKGSLLKHVTYASLAAYIALYGLGWWLLIVSTSRFSAQDALAIVAAMSLSYIVGALSMLPGGLGAREGAMVLLAPAIGMTHSDMGALALVSRAVLLMMDVIAATIGIWLMRRDFFGGEESV